MSQTKLVQNIHVQANVPTAKNTLWGLIAQKVHHGSTSRHNPTSNHVCSCRSVLINMTNPFQAWCLRQVAPLCPMPLRGVVRRVVLTTR